ncbi:2-hydroxy-3-oxopropionate reductase [Afifella sp. IM 167]|nr:2-hydroxy-3-oxopropionate reductase [Afifella sp. IM 167]
MNEETLGFIGLGVMGEPMSGHLAEKSGRPVLAFDLVPAAIQRWQDAGRKAAASAAEVMTKADIVFVSLPSGRHLEALCRGEDGLLAHAASGKVLVDLGTSPPSLSRALAAEFGEKGVAYADAPVARTRKAAEEGNLAITVGATPELFARIEPLLSCFASDVTHCGDVGSGQIVKILNNMVVVGTVVALCEAASIANASGMETQTLFEAFSKGSADSFALRAHGFNAVMPQSFPERVFSTEYMLKDVSYALEMGREAGLATKGASLGAELLGQAIDQGYGDQYWPVILKIIGERTS